MFRRSDEDSADLVYTKNELAAALRCCPRSIENHVRAGKLPRPFFVSSRSPRWSRAAVAEWIARQQKAAAGAEAAGG
jgi:predicted DNA-binding transcriptional regulator AlpA